MQALCRLIMFLLQAGMPGRQSMLMAFNVSINIVLNALLIPVFGLWGGGDRDGGFVCAGYGDVECGFGSLAWLQARLIAGAALSFSPCRDAEQWHAERRAATFQQRHMLSGSQFDVMDRRGVIVAIKAGDFTP